MVRQNGACQPHNFWLKAQRGMGDPPDDPPSGGGARPAPPPAGRPPGKFLRATTGVRNCIGREKGLLLFVLTDGWYLIVESCKNWYDKHGSTNSCLWGQSDKNYSCRDYN